MGTVNKQSVREEVDRIKSEFDRLVLDKKITPETSMLFQSMFMVVNLILSIFLEKTTKKHNKNSSKPSSQTDKDESARNPKTNGKGKHEHTTTAHNTRTVESVSIATVLECNVCGEDLAGSDCEHYE